MTTQEIADRLVALCRQGQFDTVYQELYSPETTSIEPKGGIFKEVSQGFEEMKIKGDLWHGMIEQVHGSEISEPLVADRFFTITWKSKLSLKGIKDPIMNEEICLYEVENGKIVKEQFFYTPVQEPAA